jgi:hypothetical protein
MRKLFFIISVLLISFSLKAQVSSDSIKKKELSVEELDTILDEPIPLEEVVIYKVKLSPEDKKLFLLLQNRVYKVYPFAKTASERLTILNKNLGKMKTNRDRKKYFKLVFF